jgi:hypothetical protein
VGFPEQIVPDFRGAGQMNWVIRPVGYLTPWVHCGGQFAGLK